MYADVLSECAAHDGLMFYLRLVSVKYWHHVALNSVAGWLTSSSDPKPLLEVLVRPSSVDQLIRCVAEADRCAYVHLRCLKSKLQLVVHFYVKMSREKTQ